MRLFSEEDVRSFLIALSFLFCLLMEILIDFSKFFSSTGIIFVIELSFAMASCFRLSMRGLASEAFTGVMSSTQDHESLGVRNGMIMIRIDFSILQNTS